MDEQGVSFTWRLSLQYIGGFFVAASAILFLAMALGRRPRYRDAFRGVWLFSLPIAAGWFGVAVLSAVYHPIWSAGALIGALLVWQVSLRRRRSNRPKRD